MGKTLDLIITHYTEPWKVGKPMFDMLAMQREVNFDDVGVILVNDGEDHELPSELFDGYPYDVCQISIPKGGVSKARNAGLDHSTADWVMFCDFDDSFSSIFGLYLIFCAINEDKYDTIWSCFTEETQDNEGRMMLVHHDRDFVFVHGKVHRRQYLVDNNIRFCDKLTIHEDAFLNMLAQTCCEPERIGGIKTPYYVWRWNQNSVVRSDMTCDFTLKTYDHLMRQRICLTEEYLKRGMISDAIIAIIKTVIDAYYDSQQITWRLPKNKEMLHKAENWFAAYLKRYANYYAKADVKQVAGMVKSSRANALKKGNFLIECETLSDWLKHIMNDAKPIPKELQNV